MSTWGFFRDKSREILRYPDFGAIFPPPQAHLQGNQLSSLLENADKPHLLSPCQKHPTIAGLRLVDTSGVRTYDFEPLVSEA